MKSPSIPLLQRGKTAPARSIPPFEKGGPGGIYPASWYIADLSEICRVNPTIDKASISDDLDVSFVPMPAVEAETGNIDVSGTRKFGTVKKGYTPFHEGDVLFAKITPCMENGKMAVVPSLTNGLGFGSTEFHVLRASNGVSPQYLYYYVSSQSFRREAEHNMSGAVGQRRVTTPYLSACKLPVPPSNEQNRIVAKIEELFSELDKGIESLKSAQAQLKVYRQALLKNAFEGKLTAQWRADNPDKLETADALLRRIQTEREQRYQRQLADWEAAGKQGSKPKASKPLPPLTAEQRLELPNLPEGWGWFKVGELCDCVVPNRDKPKTFSGNIPWVTTPCLSQYSTKICYENAACGLTPFEAKAYGAKVIPADSVVMTCVGTFGLSATVEIPIVINQQLHAFLPSTLVDSRMLAYRIHSGLSYFKKSSTSTTIQYLNKEKCNSFPVPICSIAEQQLIVAELESRLSQADQLDQTISTSLQQSDALRQSILKKAFSGQLVPQNPADEPAARLLERIRAEREKTGNKKSVRSR